MITSKPMITWSLNLNFKKCEKKNPKRIEKNEWKDSALLRVMIKSVLRKVVIEGMACQLPSS